MDKSKIKYIGDILSPIVEGRIAYGVFKNPVKLPRLIMIDEGDRSIWADSTGYEKYHTMTIEHYFIEKDEELENAIFQALNNRGIKTFETQDRYLPTEDLWVRYIDIEFIKGGN